MTNFESVKMFMETFGQEIKEKAKFPTNKITNLRYELIKEELINVFVPTTPNPTSGFLLMVPKKDLIYLDVSFEQASKFIVSAGTTNIN